MLKKKTGKRHIHAVGVFPPIGTLKFAVFPISPKIIYKTYSYTFKTCFMVIVYKNTLRRGVFFAPRTG